MSVMVWNGKTRLFFRVVASILVFTFIWQQVSWGATDLADYTADKLNREQTQTFAPAYLQNQQVMAESLISTKQATEDAIALQNSLQNNLSQATPDSSSDDAKIELKGPRGGGSSGGTAVMATAVANAQAPQEGAVVSVTTEKGDVIHYKGDQIDSIETKDADNKKVVIKRIDGLDFVDADNNLINAEITYADGTVQNIANGKVSTITRPDGSVYTYNADEKISSILYPDGRSVSFSYGVTDTDGSTVTVLTDSEKTSYYDTANRLKRVQFNDGKTIEYNSGVISKITEADLSQYIFDIKTNLDGTFTSNLNQYAAPDGTIYRYAVSDEGDLSSITVEKGGVTGTYNKEGSLVTVTKDGEVITSDTISQAQAAYDAAYAVYEQKKNYADSCQSVLDSANADLLNKSNLKDQAQSALSAASQALTDAQNTAATKQTAYNDAYNQYLTAQSTYNAAQAAVSTAQTAENAAQQALTTANNNLTAKQTALNQAIAARQAVEATIANINSQIQSDQTNLAQAQASLTEAQNEEALAQADYNQTLSDVNAKTTLYNNAVQFRQTKEAELNTANANLAAAHQATVAAVNALSTSPYVVSSYTTNPDNTIMLNQYENFINDGFDSYNSSIWYKPADTLVTIGAGSALLKGTGKNYNATFYANQSYNRTDMPTLSTTFKVSSTAGKFIAALDGYTSAGAYRRVGIYVYGGVIYLQTVTGSTTSNKAILMSGVKANTSYNLDFQVTAQDIKVTVWDATTQRPVSPSYTYTTTDWTAVRPYFSLYSGTATVDSVTMKGPSYSSTYDANSNLVKDVYQNGYTSAYSYQQGSITVSDYTKYLDNPYTFSTSGLWYKPADSLVTINNGIATLIGTGVNANAAFYSNQTFQRADNLTVRSTFQATSTSGKFIAGLDGYTSSGSYQRIGVTMQSGRIYVQTMSGTSTSLPKTLVTTAKANTNYNVEFQVTATQILVYLWESTATKPTAASYTYNNTTWSTARAYYSVYSGNATISNEYINYNPYQTRTISSASPEYAQIIARNQLVKNINNAIANEASAQSACNAANLALNNAKLAETQAQSNLATSQATLATKQTTLNNKIAARQAIQTTISNINTDISNLQSQLTSVQQSLASAQSTENTARNAYNQAQADVAAKQTEYNTAVQNREAKEATRNTALSDLNAKTTIKNTKYSELQTALQNVTTAQADKNAKQALYDTACANYLAAQGSVNTASANLNNAKADRDAAKANSDTLYSTLATLLSISSMFPQEDTVLKNANTKVEVLSTLYDVNRSIKEIREIDGDTQTDSNSDGLIDNITNSLGTTLYSYDLTSLDNVNGLTVDRDGIKRIYDKYGTLQSLSLDDATQIMYENGQVKEIRKADGTTITKTTGAGDMFFTESGELNDALVSYPDGSVGVYNDGELLQLISASGDTTDYQDGKIRKVTLKDGTVYDWYYDANGDILIVDSTKSEKRTYHEGKLIKLEEMSGSKLTTKYYYDATSGDLNKSEVCQNGDILYTYTYTYENGLTLIHDVDGNTQAYNKDKKLSYIVDSTGKEYGYTYVGRSEGYIEVYFPSGVKVRYDTAGTIVDATKTDGAIISNIVFDASNNPTDFTYVKDDITYKVVGGHIEEANSKDGKILYYDNGYIKSIESSLEEYQYYIADSKLYKDASFFQAGSANNISYYLNNDVATLQLSPHTLQFGTGLDGAKHVTTNESLAAGTYNFTSLVIDAGKTLTLAAGVTLNVLDILDVKGKIVGSSINIGAHKITVASGASILGLSQNIVAETVTNNGFMDNLAMAPDTNFATSGYSGISTPSNAYDGSLDTYSGYYYRERGGNGYFYNGNYTYWTWNFSNPQDISTLSWKIYDYAQTWAGASENSGAWGLYITVTHSGGTSVLVNEGGSGAGNWGGGYSQNNQLVTNSAGWTGVTQVQVRMYGKAKRVDAGAGGGNEDVTHYLYEMKADGANISYLTGSGNTPVSKPYIYPSSGTFDSNVIELNSLTLDNLSWNQNLPAGTTIGVQTRTGNTATPDGTWSDWSAPMTNSTGSQMTTAQAKYIQYRITMTSPDGHSTPSISLSANSPLAVAFKRAPTDSSEIGNISYMTRKKDGVTYGYNANGLLIWSEDASGVRTNYDPPDTVNKIDLSKLVFDSIYVEDIKTLLPSLILNDTQKTIYMKDNIIVSELRAINNADGSRSEYVQGKLSTIKMADSTEISNITFDDKNRAKDFTYIKDGTTYIVRDKNISEVITSTGVHTKYYAYGMEKSIEDAVSKIEYDYGIAATGLYTTNSAFQSGDFEDTTFYNNGGTTYLELASESLKYGTGIDGAKHVTANETLTTGTYNFTSLIIDAGVTLTVASGATIKVLDTLDVRGKLSGSNINLNAYTINVAQGGAVVGLDQTIQANTVNNNGSLGNIMMAADTSFSYSGYGGASTYSNAFDGNLDTYSGYYYRERGGNQYFYNGNYSYWTWNFPTAQDISSLSWKLNDFAQTWAGASENSGAWGLYITVTDSSGTHVLVNDGGSGAGNWSGGYAGNNQVVENNHGWTGVTQVQVRMYGKAKRVDDGAGGGNEDVTHYLYEMKADGVDLSYISTTGDVPVPTMSASHSLSGSFESDVMELDSLTFDKISWSQDTPNGTGITIQTRTGNTATPDDTWSDWSSPVSDPSGSKISSPNGKYFQYRVNMTSNDANVSPKLIVDGGHAISLSYTKFSDSLTDSYVKVKENGVTKAYNKEGVILWEEDILGNRTNYDPANPHETINVASLKANTTYTDELKKDLPTVKLGDAQKVITIYDKGNDTPVEIVSADQSITYFDNGFATKVVDKNGVVQVQYTYDADYNILKVEFVDARAKLADNYTRAVGEITTQKDAALAKLVAAEEASRADIKKKAEEAQAQLDAERKRLTDEKAQYDPNVYDLSEFDKVFAQLDDYQHQLDQQTIDAYADLDTQMANARARVNSDSSTAMQNLIDNDYNKILADICQKESSPILYQYYRKVLGRDPGDSELIYWTDKAKTDLKPVTPVEITQYLQNLAEYADREARKQNIMTALSTFFTQYMSASEADKQAMLSSLGLNPSEVVELTQADIDAITSYLSGQSLHFGDSAFTTIVEMLKAQGINKSFEDVGKEAIKIDILTGVIAKDTKGDLVISMYAMRKAAEHYGLTLYSEKINYDDLKDQVSRGNVIVHIDGKHYVLVTSVDNEKGTITYIDLTVGASGQSMTLSRAEFMAKWKGYSMAKELPADPAKQLSATQEKNIRGSGWWEDFWRGIVHFFQKIIAPVSSVLMMLWVVNPVLGGIGAVLAALNVVVQTVSFVVRTGTLMDIAWSAINAIGSAIGSVVLPNIYEAAGKFFSAIGSQILAPIQGAFQSVMPIFNTITTAVKGIATGIGQIVTLGLTDAQIATTIGYNIISQGISLGTNYLFQSLHLDPALTNIGSALLTGAIMGAVTTNTNIVAEALKFGTIAGVEELGKAVDLDPNVTHLSAMIAGSLVGGALDIGDHHLTYEKLMESIAPKILSETAYIGVTEIGNLVGVDPRISYLAGIGIRSSLQMGLSGGTPSEIWGSVTRGLLQGVTSIGVNYAAQQWDIDPLLSQMAFSVVSTAIQSTIPSNDPKNKDKSVFERMIDAYMKNALTFMEYSPIPDRGDQQFWVNKGDHWEFNQDAYDRAWGNYYWMQSAYTSQVLEFSQIVEQKGLKDALDIYGASFFNAVTVNAIVESGLSIGDYFKEKLDTATPGQTEMEVEVRDKSGNVVGKATFKKNESGAWMLVGKEDLNGYKVTGNLYIDSYGKLGYAGDATLIYTSDDYTIYEMIENDKLVKIEQKNASGAIAKEYVKNDDQDELVMGSKGQVINGRIIDHESGIDISYKEETPVKGEFTISDLLFKDPAQKIYGDLTVEQLNGTRIQFISNAPGETYQFNIIPPTASGFQKTPYSMPLNTNAADDGFVFNHDLSVQNPSGYADLVSTLFANDLAYTAPTDTTNEAMKDYFGNLTNNAIGEIVGQLYGGNVAAPKIISDIYASVAQQLALDSLDSNVVKKLSIERMVSKEIAQKFIADVNNSKMFYTVESNAKYDNITENDVRNREAELFLGTIVSDVTKGLLTAAMTLCPWTAGAGIILASAGVLDSSWNKVQLYDATQRRYEISAEYSNESNSTGYPRFRSTLTFRMGETTNSAGAKSYEVVQSTYKKYMRLDENSEWFELPAETLKTHAGDE